MQYDHSVKSNALPLTIHLMRLFWLLLYRMAKKKNIMLDWDDDESFPFQIFGICCHQPNYRVAFEINGLMDLHFKQSDCDFQSEQKKLRGCSFPMFEHRQENASLFLIQNKHLGKILMSEKPSVDFWLFSHEILDWPPTETVRKLQSIPIFLASFYFSAEDLPSTQYIHLE